MALAGFYYVFLLGLRNLSQIHQKSISLFFQVIIVFGEFIATAQFPDTC